MTEGLVVDGGKYDIVDSFCHLGDMLSTEVGGGCSSNSKSDVCMEEIQGAGTLLTKRHIFC